MTKALSRERLKELFLYEPLTGEFIRRSTGAVAGSLKTSGYRHLGIDYKEYKEHRLAFLYMQGWIPGIVDHINRNKSDNRWVNLRKADYYINGANRDDNNDFVGVRWVRQKNYYVAAVRVKGKHIHLGCFDTHLAACHARWAYDKSVCIRP